ncbi:NUDIX domain-containing protein [Streptomyces sp. NPDC004111]|uniref:NUDIX domain-containing protein n=1 Tax=Streptomyces sp. NPDC004111 TaxID=3364690 RepID=UPI0036861242
MGALVLVRNHEGAVLMVKPTYKHADSQLGWQLPGGNVHAGELLVEAAARELQEETGLTSALVDLLVVDQIQVSEDGKSAEGYNFVFDGGELSRSKALEVAVPPEAASELSAVRWVHLGQLHEHAFPYQEARVRAAVKAAGSQARLSPLFHGKPTATTG